MQLKENILFANRYALQKLLGRGGFSEVWLAKDNWTHLLIALKVYAPGQGMDTNGLQEFCGELASVYDLNHQNLLKPQHVDTWENMPYLIMAYCSQGSCASRLGKMSENEMWKLIHDVAAGLAYLHEKEVVHQDIKPDNILIDDVGNYLITDFGVSTRARSTLRKSVVSSSVGGTTAYMGPERFSRQPAPTKASDVWSFGSMCYELLEGEVPFGEIGGGMQKSGAEIPALQAHVSDALKYTITKMLQKETWDRPTAAALVEWAKNPSCIEIDYALLEEDAAPAPHRPSPITSSFSIKLKKYVVIFAYWIIYLFACCCLVAFFIFSCIFVLAAIGRFCDEANNVSVELAPIVLLPIVAIIALISMKELWFIWDRGLTKKRLYIYIGSSMITIVNSIVWYCAYVHLDFWDFGCPLHMTIVSIVTLLGTLLAFCVQIKGKTSRSWFESKTPS